MTQISKTLCHICAGSLGIAVGVGIMCGMETGIDNVIFSHIVQIATSLGCGLGVYIFVLVIIGGIVSFW